MIMASLPHATHRKPYFILQAGGNHESILMGKRQSCALEKSRGSNVEGGLELGRQDTRSPLGNLW